MAHGEVQAKRCPDALPLRHRYKFNSAHIFDSAAAYFGSDNVGLCGIAWYYKVRIVARLLCLYSMQRSMSS